MKNHQGKRVLIVLLAVIATILPVMSCGNSGEETPKGPIEIPVLFRNAGNDSATLINQFYVENFNKEFEGKYKLVVEWMPGLAEDYRTKLKMLNSVNELPALVPDLAAEPGFGDLLIEHNRLMDLKPYYDADAEWQKVTIPESVDYVTKDGKMYTTPATSAAFVGMFYNKDHFRKAGIDQFPKDWPEFWAACDKLSAAGFTPISLHTTETGWCPMLVATSSLALSKEGRDFMNEQYPTNYNIPVFIEAMNKLKRLFEYSTPDAVGGNYTLASNNFLSGTTSMIPNGPWMISSFSDPQFAAEGFEDNVGYAQFPGGVMLSWLGLAYGYGVSMDYPLEVREGVVEYIKFLARPVNLRKRAVVLGEISPKVPLTEEDLAQMSPVMQEYAKAVTSLSKTLIIYQTRWDPITQNEVIPLNLPSFVTGDITVEEFVEKMSAAGRKYAAENN